MRIIAGTARGRRFDAPKGMDTRPTLDRVKEAMFGMLQFHIPGSDVLDLFSGSGNLGLEAASRGARSVLCNDHAPACWEQIRKNVDALGFADRVEVSRLDYAACVRRLKEQGRMFDYAFLDAPYGSGCGEAGANLLLEAGLIRPGGRILVEHAAANPPHVDEGLGRVQKTRRFGACGFSVIEGTDQA